MLAISSLILESMSLKLLSMLGIKRKHKLVCWWKLRFFALHWPKLLNFKLGFMLIQKYLYGCEEVCSPLTLETTCQVCV